MESGQVALSNADPNHVPQLFLKGTDPMSSMNPATILLVDDDPLVRDCAARLLQEQGLRVISSSDGQEALDQLGNELVDVVLSDIKMPGLTGLELLEKIRARDPEIPVLLMTGYADLEMAVAAIQGGVFDFILKPFNLPQLFHAVDKALNFKHLRQFEKNFHIELTRRLEVSKRELQAHYDQQLRKKALAAAGEIAFGITRDCHQAVDFIAHNLGSLGRYVEQLLAIVDAQELAIQTSCPDPVRIAVEEQLRQLELGQIRERVKPLLSESLQGARQIKQTLQSLRPGDIADLPDIQL